MLVRCVFCPDWMLGWFNAGIVRKIHGGLSKLMEVHLLWFRRFGEFEARTTGSCWVLTMRGYGYETNVSFTSCTSVGFISINYMIIIAFKGRKSKFTRENWGRQRIMVLHFFYLTKCRKNNCNKIKNVEKNNCNKIKRELYNWLSWKKSAIFLVP